MRGNSYDISPNLIITICSSSYSYWELAESLLTHPPMLSYNRECSKERVLERERISLHKPFLFSNPQTQQIAYVWMFVCMYICTKDGENPRRRNITRLFLFCMKVYLDHFMALAATTVATAKQKQQILRRKIPLIRDTFPRNSFIECIERERRTNELHLNKQQQNNTIVITIRTRISHSFSYYFFFLFL